MFSNMKYHEMIRNGEFKMSYEDKVCSRCFRKDVRDYITYKDYNLCTKCIDNIEKKLETKFHKVIFDCIC
jgi:hypothetical protein